MQPKNASEIRSEFLRTFEGHGHRVCPSYPLVPPNDPTLLFTNAGMVQFKDVFTGKDKRDFLRAASSQKCVRAGGKHNDLENVGYTARHHTFFEMLGNFSFGDYFKSEAIRFAWEFLVVRLGLPKDRLWISVFAGEPKENLPADEEAALLWQREVGVSGDRILRFGKKDNFWSMGDTGPCGPCSEIHFDQGDRVACNQPGECQGVACECDRYLEVWNLVFMQFERAAGGKLTPLPAPSIDTGMGLERLAAVVQNQTSNYHTDLFMPLITRMGEISGNQYGTHPDADVSLRVIADHARTTSFLMAEGVLPSNEGRGYVLRRIMRRAIRHGHKLGVSELFFHDVCQEVVRQMSPVYPELSTQQSLIEKATRLEEETFRRTLEQGLRLLRKEIEDRKSQKGPPVLPGKLVFDLQTRDGFPPDLTEVIARENGFGVDQAAYQQAWERHQEVSSGSLGLAGVDEIYQVVRNETGPTEFVGNEKLASRGRVQAILLLEEEQDAQGNARVTRRVQIDRARAGQKVEVVLSSTPFYGESGGQLGDHGWLRGSQGEGDVLTALRPLQDLVVHQLVLSSGELGQGEEVEAEVDRAARGATCRNHSATHLLQAALRQALGSHVNQKGSLVSADRLRFDFSHFAPMTREEIRAVEQEVNRLIRANQPVQIKLTDIEGARQEGATMLFGEKYGETVRMVRMGASSLELCGGTHVDRTGDIGFFTILSEGSVQAGVRRVEALSGEGAVSAAQGWSAALQKLSELLKAPPAQMEGRVSNLLDREKALMREMEALKQKVAASSGGGDPLEQARAFAGVKALAIPTSGIELSSLRDFTDKLRDRMGGGVVLAFAEERGKLSAVCSVSKDQAKKLNASALLKVVFEVTGGKGGGRPDFAQGGGGDPELRDQAIEAFYAAVEKALL